jgi:hypothetical protein
MKAVTLIEGVVQNVSIWSDNSQAPDGFDLVFVEDEVSVGPGWIYDGEEFFAPSSDSEPDRSTMKLSFAQLLIGLVTEKWITAEEGRAWRDRKALPTAVVKLITNLPEAQQFAAETRAMAFTEALRLDPLVEALGAAEGKTREELDAFFLTYAQV